MKFELSLKKFLVSHSAECHNRCDHRDIEKNLFQSIKSIIKTDESPVGVLRKSSQRQKDGSFNFNNLKKENINDLRRLLKFLCIIKVKFLLFFVMCVGWL